MNETEFAKSIEAERPKLTAWLSRRFAPSDVGDLVQETLLACWTNREKYDRERDLGGWVHQQMRAVASAHRRRALVRENAAPIIQEEDVEPTTPERLITNQDTDLVLRRIVAELPPNERPLVEARFFDDLSIAAIATSYGRTVDAVDAALRRANRKMREALESMGIEDANRAIALPIETVTDSTHEDGAADSTPARITPQPITMPSPGAPRDNARREALETVAKVGAAVAIAVAVVLYLLQDRPAWAERLASVTPERRFGAGIASLAPLPQPEAPPTAVEPPPTCPAPPAPVFVPFCPSDDPAKNAGPRSLGRVAAGALEAGDRATAKEACRRAGPDNVFCKELLSLQK